MYVNKKLSLLVKINININKFEENRFKYNSIVFFNSKKHLQDVFFAKIKIDNRKWPFVKKECLFFLKVKICQYGHQKIRLSASHNGQSHFTRK